MCAPAAWHQATAQRGWPAAAVGPESAAAVPRPVAVAAGLHQPSSYAVRFLGARVADRNGGSAG